MAEEHLHIKFSHAQLKILSKLDGALLAISCVAGAGNTKLLQAILLWVYYLNVHMGCNDISMTYCASTQELVKRTMEYLADRNLY